MDANQIILLIIVVLASLIAVFGIYFLIIFLMNRKREKKVDTIFNPNNLVEEESLMNVMDEKKNVEFQNSFKNEDQFVLDQEEVKMVATDSMTREQQVNPFGVDLTMHTTDNTPIEIPDEDNSQNRFFK